MCGKFTQMMSWRELVTLADILVAAPSEIETVTPMRFATVVTLDDEGKRRAVKMRWGLVPPDAKDPISAKKHIHARAETIDSLRTFRDAFAHRRGLVAVSTFNEGKELTPTKTEQYVITPNNHRPLAIAVIWERWSEHNAGALLTFAMVTTAANALIGTITDRMPAVLAEEDWAKWLGEAPASPADLKALLKSAAGDWDMRPQTRTPPPRKPGRTQPDLF